MPTDEIVKLTRETIADLLAAQSAPEQDFEGDERRQSERWPFPGTVEIRIANGQAQEPSFATCRDVSSGGMGMKCDCHFETDTPLEISVHLPEASFYGKAIVRYCAEAGPHYILGVEFDFEE